MPDRPLLEAYIAPDDSGELRRKIAYLEAELTQSQAQLRGTKQELLVTSRGLAALRHQLEPLYNALRMVFGELDNAGVSGVETAGPSPRVASLWESWKSKLGGKQAEFIQALLEHGEMTAVQLKVATHTGTSTVPQVIYKLNHLGLINKQGGKYSLKEL